MTRYFEPLIVSKKPCFIVLFFVMKTLQLQRVDPYLFFFVKVKGVGNQEVSLHQTPFILWMCTREGAFVSFDVCVSFFFPLVFFYLSLCVFYFYPSSFLLVCVVMLCVSPYVTFCLRKTKYPKRGR